MGKILVSAVRYPHPNGDVSLMYIHTRNLYYISQGLNVTVLNFNASENYVVDGINVISLSTYENNPQQYDIFVAHAAQLKEHYKFLKKYGDNFKRYVFFFHGYEVLRVNTVYPKPYPYIQTNPLKRAYQFIYDELHDNNKLRIWRKFFIQNYKKTQFVFVSNWMFEEFLKWTKVPKVLLEDRYMITYNCVGKSFEDNEYQYDSEKEYDYITVRSNIDGSKYCVDIVNNLAFSNPDRKFLLIGKGNYFNHNKKAPNLTWINRSMKHTEIVGFLQKSKCALMPTRTDAQGVMTCEMATLGMPVITSDIPVCHEALDEFPNVMYISNYSTNVDLQPTYETIARGLPYCKNKKYYNVNTSGKEVLLLKNILDE